MIELAQHIEVLLLENDCVIVPGLGGFVAHYTPAMRVAEENLFLPPTRIIGFNPQLKMNDGLLVQSYMAVYGTNFSDATKMVNREVEELFAVLHETGQVDLSNVGALHYSIRNTYNFTPYDNKITTPYLYGLNSFVMQELAELKKPSTEKIIPFMPAVSDEQKRKRILPFNLTHLANAAAMIAIVALFFFLSTPIENTEVVEGNYAQLLPAELFEKIEKQSLAVNPIVIRQSNKSASSSKKKPIAPITVKEIKVGRTTASVSSPKPMVAPTPKAAATPKAETKPEATSVTSSGFYHIIVASLVSTKDANDMAKQLVEKGFTGAKSIVGDGKIRVSVQSYATEAEAYKALNKIRQNESYQNSWVLKK